MRTLGVSAETPEAHIQQTQIDSCMSRKQMAGGGDRYFFLLLVMTPLNRECIKSAGIGIMCTHSYGYPAHLGIPALTGFLRAAPYLSHSILFPGVFMHVE